MPEVKIGVMVYIDDKKYGAKMVVDPSRDIIKDLLTLIIKIGGTLREKANIPLFIKFQQDHKGVWRFLDFELNEVLAEKERREK